MYSRLVSLILIITPAVAAADGLPPKPDFEKRVDYVAWYEQLAGKPKPNAYDAYAKFMPGLAGSKVAESDWPKFNGMMTDPESKEAPAPWDPKEHEAWEASYRRTRTVLQQFAEAAKIDGFAAPSGKQKGTESAANLLMRVGLPHLQYLRQCCTGSIEAAWRRDTDGVSAKKLIEAIELSLRVARQLDHGLLVPEHQTAAALRNQAYATVAWGFAHHVLSETDAKDLQALLQSLDGKPHNLQRAVRGDAAATLDALQFIFGPLGGGGETHVDSKRFADVTGVQMGFGRMALGSRIETDAPGCAEAYYNCFKVIDEHCGQKWSTSHIAPIHSATEAAERVNQVTRSMPPGNWENIYAQGLTCETRRRGTATLIELFAYKARKGKWPPKLSNLNKKTMDAIGDDPMSGKPFVYKLVDDAPMLYSVAMDGQDDGGHHDETWGGPGSGIDFVFWPMPGANKPVAEAALKAAKAETITPLSKISPAMAGKEVTVVAKVIKVEARPSREHRRTHTVTLIEDGTRMELIYFADAADALSAKQEIKAGLRVRVIAIVEKTDKGVQLMLRDADALVVEKDKPAP